MGIISHKGNHIQGFTSIELIAVLTIIAIICAVVVTKLTATSTAKVVSETEILKANLRYAQFRALSYAATTSSTTLGFTNAPWGILFGNGQYTLQINGITSTYNLPNESSPTHTVPSGISIGYGKHIYRL
jgi:type II secretory pathway pseudopilin PulG